MFVPIKLSESAIDMVRNIMTKKGIPEGYSLRIGIRGGTGCLGVNYVLGFDKQKEGDELYVIEDIPILIEKKHTMFLIGMIVDWVSVDGQQGFTFYKESTNKD